MHGADGVAEGEGAEVVGHGVAARDLEGGAAGPGPGAARPQRERRAAQHPVGSTTRCRARSCGPAPAPSPAPGAGPGSGRRPRRPAGRSSRPAGETVIVLLGHELREAPDGAPGLEREGLVHRQLADERAHPVAQGRGQREDELVVGAQVAVQVLDHPHRHQGPARHRSVGLEPGPVQQRHDPVGRHRPGGEGRRRHPHLDRQLHLSFQHQRHGRRHYLRQDRSLSSSGGRARGRGPCRRSGGRCR